MTMISAEQRPACAFKIGGWSGGLFPPSHQAGAVFLTTPSGGVKPLGRRDLSSDPMDTSAISLGDGGNGFNGC